MKTNNSDERTALITDIQRFCMHDGPGVRTTVFFKGCPLRCRWCHNPETQSARPEVMFTPTQCILCGACAAVCGNSAQLMTPERIFDRSLCRSCGSCAAVCPTRALNLSGKTMSVRQIMDTVEKDRPFYGEQGGLTVSGGEPTMQPEALLSLLGAAKERNVSTALETCGVFPQRLLGELCRLTDLFLFDIKDTDAGRLKANTGAELSVVSENLRGIDSAGGKTVLRCILIPGVNLSEAHRRALAELYHSLSHCLTVELLPYHPYGAGKAERIGKPAQEIYPVPEKAEILAFAAALKAEGVPVKCYGSELK